MSTNTEADGPNPNQVFVGNLAWATTNDSLREKFEECGEVTMARVIREWYSVSFSVQYLIALTLRCFLSVLLKLTRTLHPSNDANPIPCLISSGRSRGFGFVTFANSDSASTALETMNNQELDGRTIRVDVADHTLAKSGPYTGSANRGRAYGPSSYGRSSYGGSHRGGSYGVSYIGSNVGRGSYRGAGRGGSSYRGSYRGSYQGNTYQGSTYRVGSSYRGGSTYTGGSTYRGNTYRGGTFRGGSYRGNYEGNNYGRATYYVHYYGNGAHTGNSSTNPSSHTGSTNGGNGHYTNGNGHYTNGNGHHMNGNGHHTNGNGHNLDGVGIGRNPAAVQNGRRFVNTSWRHPDTM
ncbi:hypothetical protein HDV00_009116 [Rhizophlyctis rosea]|nr:hypothetical protein HDV00_009116 [Rhizophlyctis rosea]